eukprot:1829811-Lingulodinium_polyedra.AAC.1
MVRLSRRFAATTVCKSHVCAFLARAGFRPARGARGRAVCEPLRRRRVDSTALSRSVLESSRN